jgi:Undecaprenyl-phosphate galactose phosphotransferase WbaP
MLGNSQGTSALTDAGAGLQPLTLSKSYERRWKRTFDISIAAFIVILLLPLMACLCILIRLGSQGPILFRQRRIGMRGEAFDCMKFRTMHPDAERMLQVLLEKSSEARREWEQNFKLKDDPRITTVGKFLRKTSLDELPQLFNVLRGDMSLVGPRPIVADEMERYGNVLPLYLSVRPGLTGLWQISGRSDCSYPERVSLDEQYLRKCSFWNDTVIVVKTIKVVLSGYGSY